MAPTRRANQDTSRVQEENNTRFSGAGGPPPNGPQPTIHLTPEELQKIIADAVKMAATKKATSRHDSHPEQQWERPLEEERGEEERESSADSKSPTVAEELEELRKKGCPFSDIIVREPLPGYFKSAKIKDYDGSSDPEEHLARFENMAMLHCYEDQIKCKVFLTTLIDSPQRWFEGLAPQSIRCFEDFQKVFLHQFSSSKKYKKTAFSLFEVKQRQDETLRAYLKRFNRVALDVPTCAPETKTTAFMQGLWEGDFFRSLTKKLPGNFEDLLSRAEEYINMEEAQNQKREALKRARRDRAVKTEDRAPKRNGSGHFPHVPLKVARDREIQECRSNEAPPPNSAARAPRPEQKGYCTLHKDCAHNTNECRVLGRNSNKHPVSAPHLPRDRSRQPPWLSRRSISNMPPKTVSTPSRRRGGDVSTREERIKPAERKDPSPSRGIIKMISGGSTDGDSNRARKARSTKECLEVDGKRRDEPVISFGPEDLRGVSLPHNDALVIQARVANYDVFRVFVDNGSSVNVIFKEALVQMDLHEYQLEAIETALFGFAGHAVYPEGEITLPLTLGMGDLRKTVMTTFTVVDAPSSYNVILGRPAMNEMKAMASTYHQKIKFPVRGKVGEVKGDLPSSRRCYGETVRVDQKRERREWKGKEHQEGTHEREVHFVAEEEQEVVEIELAKNVRVARDICATTRVNLLQCLKTNVDVFAWSQQELSGISPRVAEHKLNILPGSRPVKQKKRHFGPEKDKVIEKQVEELLKAGHVREVHFPSWLSNVVLVPKSTGKWRMCVDFRDLNKACPKDCYPLPRIDQLVDSTSGCELLSFLDAYQGYHQIPLALGYVPTIDESCISEIDRSQYRGYRIKLNPAKYVFGVKSGKFLGFMVTDRGIEAFQDLKKHLAELPVLAKPEPGEKLWVYLSATEVAVSSVLVKEEGTDQKPIYYVSHALRGAELRYSELEKIALALVMTVRKLRPYFLSHPIVVLANYPLGRIMTHAEVSGRMIKWTVELGEYDIEYKPRAAIKAHALSDFLTEIIHPGEEELWRVFVDGASNISGCGVGIVLVSLLEEKVKLALKIDSRATNNEAVLAGLRAAREVGASRIIIYSDSQLVTQQIKGSYEVKNEKMLKYLKLITSQASSFTDWSIEQIPREENTEADMLAKLAASLTEVSTREVLCFTRLVSSLEEETPPPPANSWMAPLMEYTENKKIPEDPVQAARIRRQAPRFVLLNNILYRRSHQGPLLKCLVEDEVDYVLREIHEGCCGEHLGATALSRKAILAGFCWPRMTQDAARFVQKCQGCQHHSNFHHRPAASLQPVFASCPFDQWGLDIVGPFPIARAQKKFLLVAVDYFSKWVEAEPLARITKDEVMKFLWKIIVCRYGIPRKLISDNGRQFQGKKITSWCQEMKITQSFTSVAYPQANGQTEVTNRIIVQALKARLHGKGKDWVEELPSVLWAYRTTPRSSTQETPYNLVYGSEAVLPVEIGLPSARIKSYLDNNDQTRAIELDLIEE
ncbi:uncharacterized protein [Primulina eburnea]|uniref:uncharacterized protein n=1 Tax=Primulina eburnea TaxID=1245227 RepID=UPI003C6CBAA2